MRRQAQRRHEQRSPEAQRADESTTAEKVVEQTREGYREWAEDPSKSDYPGVDTGPDHDEGREIDRMGFVAPLSGHRLEATAEAGLGLAEMAGFGGHRDGGHDAMEGIDALLMDPSTDAMKELHAPSATRGGPLELDEYETLYSDDAGFGDLNPALPLTSDESPDYFDWTQSYKVAPEERI